MKAAVLLSMGLFLLPAASAQADGFEFFDSEGDVVRNNSPESGPDADTNDILDARVEMDGVDFRFVLHLKDLAPLQENAQDLDFIAQYALSFQARDGHEGYSVRASFGGLFYTLNPLGGWRFQLHDQETDTWTDADGEQDGSRLVWRVDASSIGEAQLGKMRNWSAQAWNTYGDGTQTADSAAPAVGLDVDELTAPVDGITGKADFAYADPRDDVTSGGDPYWGGGAASADVLAVRLAEHGNELIFELELQNVSTLEQEAGDPGFVAQYALSFVTEPGQPGFSMRASYDGRDRARNGETWGFNIHEKGPDEWPAANGRVEGSTLIWNVPRERLGIAEGTTLSEWSVQTWNSFDHRDQYGDWASTDRSYTVGAAPDPVEASEAAAEATAMARYDASEIPSSGVVMAWLTALVMALAIRRR